MIASILPEAPGRRIPVGPVSPRAVCTLIPRCRSTSRGPNQTRQPWRKRWKECDGFIERKVSGDTVLQWKLILSSVSSIKSVYPWTRCSSTLIFPFCFFRSDDLPNSPPFNSISPSRLPPSGDSHQAPLATRVLVANNDVPVRLVEHLARGVDAAANVPPATVDDELSTVCDAAERLESLGALVLSDFQSTSIITNHLDLN